MNLFAYGPHSSLECKLPGARAGFLVWLYGPGLHGCLVFRVKGPSVYSGPPLSRKLFLMFTQQIPLQYLLLAHLSLNSYGLWKRRTKPIKRFPYI